MNRFMTADAPTVPANESGQKRAFKLAEDATLAGAKVFLGPVAGTVAGWSLNVSKQRNKVLGLPSLGG